MVMILLPPLLAFWLLSPLLWPSNISAYESIHPKQQPLVHPFILRPLPSVQWAVFGPHLICAVPSSMPDKSMCQHLFLCCQFFMVFDDISPIVRPATHAVFWPVCLPVPDPFAHLVKSPWSRNRGIEHRELELESDCWHGHRSALFVWPLAQELWLPHPS